jgi:glycosyltransferase involved in cell wall biosynthesis
MKTELINVMEGRSPRTGALNVDRISVRQRQRARIAIVATVLPPRLDGIGDHTHRLAAAMAEHADVSVFTTRGFTPDAIAGVTTRQCFAIEPRREVADLAPVLSDYAPDWVILQYNPFCFGKRGLNPYLPALLGRIKKSSPGLKLAVMVHEMWMPAATLRYAVMSLYQRWQLREIAAVADLTLFSTGPWFLDYRRKHPERACGNMPVGSNLDLADADRNEVRGRLKIGSDTIVVGTFGGSHPSRLVGHVGAAARRLRECGRDVRILSIGSAGADLKSRAEGIEVIDLGPLDAPSVSQTMRAVDIYCSPFIDGVSCRRGSFFAGLQHGLPTVTTTAYHTEPELSGQDGISLFAPRADDQPAFVHAVKRLADDAALRARIGSSGRELFEAKYDLPVLVRRWLRELGMEATVEPK